MSVEVVVPWAGGCPHRERAWAWVADRYAERHPTWTVVRATGQSGSAWCKAKAVTPTIQASTADTVIVADADVWTDGLAAAVEQVDAGAPWAIPHERVLRLTEAATDRYISGDTAAPELAQDPYVGIIGGGFVIAPREMMCSIPLDGRFVGWGQEDESWAVALECLAGEPWRGTADLIHLWHPPQERLTRTRGSMDGWMLRRRYVRARTDPVVMRALIEEGRLDARTALESDGHDHPPHSFELG